MAEESQKYVLGEFSFETFHEYRDGQEDVRKIECINKELDIQDPEVAVRLYNDIRTGKITFKSPIGDQFFDHLADVVAENSVGLLEEKAIVEEAEGQVRYQKYMGLALIAVALVSFGIFVFIELQDIWQTRQLAKLANQVKQATEESADESDEDDLLDDLVDDDEEDAELDEELSEEDSEADEEESEEEEVVETTYIDRSTLTVLEEYASLYEENPDTVGWLTIEGTSIDYVVVQSDDNDYYLRRSFYGESLTAGTLFVDYRGDIVNPTYNTIIYGHNMRSGTMFGGLKKYLEEGYLEEHPTITFNTIYEYRTYEILAVCLSTVSYQDEDDYRYYDFISASTLVELNEFKENVAEHAVYGDVEELTLQDQILTLSTCNTYAEDGRLFIVAKRVY